MLGAEPMPDSLKRLVPNDHIWIIYIVSFLYILVITYFQWILGLGLLLIFGLSLAFTIYREKMLNQTIEGHISRLSHRIRRVGQEALLEMPIGIILYDNNYV